MRAAGFGRFGEPALWIVVVLGDGPQPVARLLDEVRRRNGPIGPGTLFGTIARLEAVNLIEPLPGADRRPSYRLVAARAGGSG